MMKKRTNPFLAPYLLSDFSCFAFVLQTGDTRESLPFDLLCGYVGFFGYELKEESGISRSLTPEQILAQKTYVRSTIKPCTSITSM